MAGGFLDVTKRHAGIEGSGDECLAERVRSYRLRDACSSGDASNDPAGPVAVKSSALGTDEDRTVGALANGEIDGPGGPRCERDDDRLAALAQDGEGAVSALEAESLDVCADRLGDSQPVEGE